MIDGFVDSGGVRSFHHLEEIVDGYQSTNLPHFTRKIGRQREFTDIALIQLRV
jgi:hypothetical protein